MKQKTAKAKKKAYQFKITLEGPSPEIWRRIQVPENYSFWDLHVAIQDSMGWTDSHLHVFREPYNGFVRLDEIGYPDEDKAIDDPDIKPGWKIKISKYFKEPEDLMEYEYDFGDSWLHKVVLENILPAKPGKRYPCCIAVEKACPPEDCGGVDGFYTLVKILDDPRHKEYKSTVEWLGELYRDYSGGIYNPEEFQPDKVEFDNPIERLKRAFSDPDIDSIEDFIRKKYPSLSINGIRGK